MVATLINALSIIIGATLGIVFKKYIKENICQSLLKAIGIVIIIFGLIGVVQNMLVISYNNDSSSYIISSKNSLLLIIAVSLGTYLGEVIKIDDKLNSLSKRIETKLNKSNFSEGLVTATLIFCVGAMAITGSIEAALGNPNIIYLKAIIDGITALVLSSTLGIGVVFAFIPVIIYQGFFTILGSILSSNMSNDFIEAFSMVGNCLICCLGINFLLDSTKKIKVANMLPSLLIVVIYFIFK